MPNTSHSLRRNKSKLEPISAEELAGDSTMTGFSNLFRIPVQRVGSPEDLYQPPDNLTGDGSQHPPDTLRTSSHQRDGSKPLRVNNISVAPPDSLSGRNDLRSPDNLSRAVGPDKALRPPDNLTGPFYQSLDGLRVDMKCIRPFDNVQSAHTPSEHLVYTTMWKMLGSRDDDSPSREGILAMSAVASKVSISVRNLRRVLRSLEAKLALEITEYEDKTQSIPRRYRIWGFRPTIQRRRNAGYCFIYRNRNIITLARLCPPDNLTVDPPDNLTASSPDSLAALPPDKLTGRPPDSLSPLVIKEENNKKTTTTLRTLLQAQLPIFDDAAVEQLWGECRRQVPDVTVEEVSDLFRQKLESRPRGIENQNGFLLRAVTRSCTPAAVAAFRQRREITRELDLAEDRARYWRQTEEHALYWQRRASYWETLNDPNASTEEKRIAQEALATMTDPVPVTGS